MYSYDHLHRLTNAAYSDGSSQSFSYDAAGNRVGRLAAGATRKVDQTSPSIPTNLIAISASTSQLRVGWNRSSDTGGSGMAGYVVFVNGAAVATNGMQTDFILTGLLPGSDYCVSIAALDKSGNQSATSDPLCIHTDAFIPPTLSIRNDPASSALVIEATGGTVGPYDLWESTDLIAWQHKTTVWLPFNSNLVLQPATNSGSYFYRLGWSTNTP